MTPGERAHVSHAGRRDLPPDRGAADAPRRGPRPRRRADRPARRRDRPDGRVPWDVKELLASHDILGLPFPEAYGGLGGDLLTVCLAIEQISRVCATSGLILAVQELGALPILLAGTDEQKRAGSRTSRPAGR